MMENYGKVLEYTENAQNAAGTSAQKYEHYLESLEAKINSLTVAWEQFIQDLNSSNKLFNTTNTIKAFIGILQGLLWVVDSLAAKVPVIQSIAITFGAFKGFLALQKNMGSFVNGFKSFFGVLKI